MIVPNNILDEMEKKHKMKVIKDKPTKENYVEDIDEQAHAQGRGSSYDVIEQMENEWPQMTREFKKIREGWRMLEKVREG